MKRLLLALALLLPSLANAQGTLKFVPQADLRILDTAWTTAAITRNHGYLIYEPLFSYDSASTPRGQAVETWSASPDGMAWRFTLRPGMVFQDGSPVTARDAVASLERWSKRKASGSTLRARMAGITAIDERSFEITLSRPFGLVLETLSDAIQPTFVLRERDAQADPFTQIQFKEVIGSGPFRFALDEWVPGAKAVYLKSPSYKPRPEAPDGFWGGKIARLDRVEWIVMPEPTTQVQALVNGEVDVLDLPVVDLLPVLKKAPGVVVTVTDRLGSQASFNLNTKHFPFDKPEGRLAMVHALDQSQLLAAAIGDTAYARPCLSVMACGSPNESSAGTAGFAKPDPARSRALLASIGYKGEPVVLMDPADQPIMHQMALVAAADMQAAGFTVDVQATDWGTVVTRAARPDRPGAGSPGWHTYPGWSPTRVVSSPLTATQLRAPCNQTTFTPSPCDATLESARDAFFAAVTPTERKAAMDALQTRFYEVMPYALAGQFLAPKAWRSSVTGVVDVSEFVFWGVSKK